MTAVCLSCGTEFAVPAIGKCPACSSQQIRRVDPVAALVRELYAIARSVTDDPIVQQYHRDGAADFGPWLDTVQRAEALFGRDWLQASKEENGAHRLGGEPQPSATGAGTEHARPHLQHRRDFQ